MVPNTQQIAYARWMVLLFGLSAPAFSVLLVGATWAILATGRGLWPTVLGLAVMWVIFLGLLIVPESWYVWRIWRGVPALQIDGRGLLWGDDWNRDVGIEWREIDRIRSRREQNRYYSDRLLLIERKDGTIPRRLSRIARAMAWLSQTLYGTPYVLALGTLRIQGDDLIAAIRERFDGPIDLSEIS